MLHLYDSSNTFRCCKNYVCVKTMLSCDGTTEHNDTSAIYFQLLNYTRCECVVSLLWYGSGAHRFQF